MGAGIAGVEGFDFAHAHAHVVVVVVVVVVEVEVEVDDGVAVHAGEAATPELVLGACHGFAQRMDLITHVQVDAAVPSIQSM
ncbi:MAG: hypothetical protein M3Q42_12820 [Pseudomonadota bacterium]|nr:hypothetical protein [Pseudomonadota bacterium]